MRVIERLEGMNILGGKNTESVKYMFKKVNKFELGGNMCEFLAHNDQCTDV